MKKEHLQNRAKVRVFPPFKMLFLKNRNFTNIQLMCDTPDKGQAHSTSDRSSGCDLLRSHICSEKLCVKISSEQGFPSQRDVGKDFSSIVSEACGGRDTAS